MYVTQFLTYRVIQSFSIPITIVVDVDCEMTPWSEWTETVKGTEIRTRSIQTEPQNNGNLCGDTRSERQGIGCIAFSFSLNSSTRKKTAVKNFPAVLLVTMMQGM